jgi:16S rRNA (uracil1498-N3)-methyltransferase
VLSGDEGRHAATVRRLGPGEHVDITDGAGTLATCLVTAASPGRLELAVTGRSFEPAPAPRLTVIQAIPKGDRGEQAVETMTEVGADVIVPWAAERCVAQWRGDKAARGAARWRATAAAAARQSRRRWFPEVTELAGTGDVLARVAAVTAEAGPAGGAGLAVLLDPDAAASLTAVVAAAPGRGEIILLVGPEGGVSAAETARLTAAGATGARLGPTVLRASSAGAVAAALVLTASGRWS